MEAHNTAANAQKAAQSVRAAALQFFRLEPGGDSTAFRVLNEEWIQRLFTLEAVDHEILNHPEDSILAKGGRILQVAHEGVTVGCVALIPKEPGVCEVGKMAVVPGLRGLGIGRRLLGYALEQAEEMGVRKLTLNSSTKLPNAVHLYETVGFRHVPKEQWPPSEYNRTDVVMEMDLPR